MHKICNVIVVGGGTAGLISALALRLKLPELQVTVVRSKALGVIGVGEGTIANFNNFFFDFLGLDRATFYRETNATWKLGIRFNWGTRGHFNYGFEPEASWKWNNQKYQNGYYGQGDLAIFSQNSALMDAGKAFLRTENGDPLIREDAAYHLENVRFVNYLEAQAEACGITLVDAHIDEVISAGGKVESLTLGDGSTVSGDLYIDASGFRSLLLRQSLDEPFESFKSSLFCDRAITGAWQRTEEPILPYTTSDTMDAGWSWRIDHEHHINRGYVYSSAFISDEQAEAEFRNKNPQLDQLNRLSFAPGKCRNLWVENVVAIGNSGGFVEPLEATSIGLICSQSRKLVQSLSSSHSRPDSMVREFYNRQINEQWESARRFLALHYKLNRASDTAFWQACRAETEVGEVIEQMMDLYRNHGPDTQLIDDLLPPNGLFGPNGYLVIMLGLGLEYDQSPIEISEQDWHNWREHCTDYQKQAQASSMSVAESLDAIRADDWEWY